MPAGRRRCRTCPPRLPVVAEQGGGGGVNVMQRDRIKVAGFYGDVASVQCDELARVAGAGLVFTLFSR